MHVPLDFQEALVSIAEAVITVARRDAEKGCPDARAWLAQVKADICEVAPRLARRVAEEGVCAPS